MDHGRKTHEISLQIKKIVLDLLNQGNSQDFIAKQFDISKSAIGLLQRNRQKILSDWQKSYLMNVRKRNVTKMEEDELNVLVLAFYNLCREKDIPVTGAMLKNKAKELALEFRMEEFKANSEWLDAFKLHNHIHFKARRSKSKGNTPSAKKSKSTHSNNLDYCHVKKRSALDQKELHLKDCKLRGPLYKNSNQGIVDIFPLKPPVLKQAKTSNNLGLSGDTDLDGNPPPNHRQALQYVKALIKYSASYQPWLLDDFFHVYSDIENELNEVEIARQEQFTRTPEYQK